MNHTYYLSYGKDWIIEVMELVETKYHLNLESLKSRRLRSLCHGKFGTLIQKELPIGDPVGAFDILCNARLVNTFVYCTLRGDALTREADKFGIDREKLNDVQLAEKLMKRIGGVWQ